MPYASITYWLSTVFYRTEQPWEGIEQLQRIVSRFREIHPEHKDKAVMGILAGVDWDWGVQGKAREAGFLTAVDPGRDIRIDNARGFRGAAVLEAAET
uniref:Uncharacterized protein n=1 Tax=Candidatus Kentrum sp. LPFa TaxID=2126335 RepID=A0A450XTL1_9GAMM|nr:MAG: hypothetical protein BECKLPF1236A_GA0070988_1017510 [Candidatus Kentron sp. LPFa]VFK32641.1 MAG: hypothetical protein BECKLPF1236C_GA0070990_1017410 [Candidatus Kentron sp. LPFa]